MCQSRFEEDATKALRLLRDYRQETADLAISLDADTILKIKPALTQYLKEFDDCFGRQQCIHC